MKKKFKKVVGFVLMFLMLFCHNVYAETLYNTSYHISLKTDTKNVLKSGDIIKLEAGISCIEDSNDVVIEQGFNIIYDKDVFELLWENSDNKTPYEVRSGWNISSYSARLGQGMIKVKAASSDNYIKQEEASSNCTDLVDATLLTFKLKVKDVSNQNTKVQVINEVSYSKEIKEVSFTIYNPSTNNYLSSLKVENYELNSEFNKNKTDYEVYVPYDVEKVNITATTEDNKANLLGTGEKEIAVGDNKISLVVTAENGTKKTYTVNVIRKDANDDTTLSKVLVTDSNKKKVSLAYNEKTKTYTGDVSSEITFIYFDIKCSGDDCFVDELKPESIQEGRNEFKFTVVSQNGDKENYKIIINKEATKKDNLVLYLSICLGISLLLCIILLILYFKNRHK